MIHERDLLVGFWYWVRKVANTTTYSKEVARVVHTDGKKMLQLNGLASLHKLDDFIVYERIYKPGGDIPYIDREIEETTVEGLEGAIVVWVGMCVGAGIVLAGMIVGSWLAGRRR